MGLELKDVCKVFGDKEAVHKINLKLDKPGVYGLLGTNGAGKTTTIRMILGIIKKTSGIVTWNGKEVIRENVNFGYLPEERGVYPKTKVYDQLLYFAKLKGMKKEEASKAIDYWLKRLEVEEYRNVQADKLSKGNQQKIQFITAILHDPELIVLDEPFSGLDPINTEILKTAIKELISKGKYIIMSSHQMASVEEFCTDITILNRGKTVLQGNLPRIKNSYKSDKIEISTEQPIEDFIKKSGLEVLERREEDYILKIKSEEQGHDILKELMDKNIGIRKFEMKKPSLNEIFIEKVGDVQ
jgi:ABC-2 type transport system ATP-binding protein